MTKQFIFIVAIAVVLASTLPAAGQLFTDPNDAGPDYAPQGEYKGEIGSEGLAVGAQVIALGAGGFDLRLYIGGLPGDGWSAGDEIIAVTGEAAGGVVKFMNDQGTATIQEGTFVIRNNDGEEVGTLKKITRKSSTLGAKPPEGAIVLCDGSTADRFENGELTDDKLLKANCWSKEKFDDHKLHVEFRTPFKPTARGQARGNSGVYIQSRYELQVLDSFGLSGENNECGGIYSIAKPAVNMCYPPLTWQTYDIDFTAARYNEDGEKTKNPRVTIKHNGVVIHDNLELPNGTPGRAPEGPGPEGLYLQGHGNPVVYRNIWVVKK